jgi:ubiquinone/menaquinone biosynthesis C-methylase UbiE
MSWDGSAQAFDQLHQSTLWKSIIQQVITFAAPEGSDLALEVGSKTGRFALALNLKAREVQCIEPNATLIKAAEQNIKTARVDGISFEQGEYEDLPFADGSFDLTCSVFTLHQCKNAAKAVQELARVTRTGGRVVCLVPSPGFTKEAVERWCKKNAASKQLLDALVGLAQETANGKSFSEDALADLFGEADIYEIELDSAFNDLLFIAKARCS